MTNHTRKWVGRAALSLSLGVLLSGLLYCWADRPCRQDLRAYVIFDTSESLGASLFDDLKRIASSLVHGLELGDSFMLVEVFEDVYVQYKHVEGSPEGPLRTGDDLAAVLQEVESLRIREGYQGTRLDKALEIVAGEMQRHPPSPTEACFLIMLTDGAPDYAPQFGKYIFPDQTRLYVLGNRHPGLLDELETMGWNAVVSTDEADSLQASARDLLSGIEVAHSNSLLVRCFVWIPAGAVLALFLLGFALCLREAYFPLCGVLSEQGHHHESFDLATDRRQPWWRVLHPRWHAAIGADSADWPRPGGGTAVVYSSIRGMMIHSLNGCPVSVDGVGSTAGRPVEIHRHNDWIPPITHDVNIGGQHYKYTYQPPE